MRRAVRGVESKPKHCIWPPPPDGPEVFQIVSPDSVHEAAAENVIAMPFAHSEPPGATEPKLAGWRLAIAEDGTGEADTLDGEPMLSSTCAVPKVFAAALAPPSNQCRMPA